MNFQVNPLRHEWRGFRFVGCAVTILCAGILLVAGCGRNEPRADIVIVNGIEPETLDPGLVTGQAEMRIVSGIFEGLLRLDAATSDPVAGLADRWEKTPDGLTYTFHLRTNLTWSTGGAITADDVVYSWIRVLDPATASGYSEQLYYLKNAEDFNNNKIKDPGLVGVHALDRYTVKVELAHPTAYFLDLCAFPTLAVVPRETIAKYGDSWIMARPLPCSGPYELEAWRLNDKVRLRKNHRYWDAANTRIEVADFLPIGSSITALNLYETGAVDLVWDKELVPTELLDVLLKRPDFHSYTILGTYFIRCNVTKKPFDDPRVRRALAMVIDRDRITKRITRCGEVPAFTFTPPGIGNYHAPASLFEYNPAKARELLAEAGYPGGKGFPRFSYMFNAAAGGAAKNHAKIAVELQQMFRDGLGIEMELRQVEWKVYLADETKLDYDLDRSSWIGDYNDPDTFLNLLTSDNENNRTGWKSKEYDDLIKAADNEVDTAKREKILQDAETMLVRDAMPVIPLYYYVGFNYHDTNKIHGVYESIIDMHPLNEIWKTGTNEPRRTAAIKAKP